MISPTFRLLMTLTALVPFYQPSLAQDPPRIDSLLRQLNYPDDSSKVEVYITLANEYVSSDPEMALEYATKGETLATKINNLSLIGKAKSRKGVAYYHMNQMELSTENYFEALTIFDSLGLQYEKARSLNNIGWNLRLNNQPDDAIKYFEQGLEIAEDLGEMELMQVIFNNLGTAYRYKNEKEKALEIYRKSLKINRKQGNKKWEAFNLNNIGLIYLDIEQYEKSEEAFLLAGSINLEVGQLDEYAKNLLNRSMIAIQKGDLNSASSLLAQADSVIENHDFQREKLVFYFYKTQFLEKAEKFREAFENLGKYIALENELNNLSANNQTALLRRKYELAQEEIELQRVRQKVQEQRVVIFGGIGLFLFLLAILLLVLKLYKSKNSWAKNIEKLSNEVRQKNDELAAMNEEMRGINDNLEQIVKDRTTKIQLQNEKLIKYAFINSHEIRGPLARILGLINLIALDNKKMNANPSFILLDKAAHELDKEVKQASEILADEDFFLDK